MSKRILKLVSNAMSSLGIEYAFATYRKHPIVYPYFVGEFSDTEGYTESGLQEGTFILNGFTRDEWLTLEDAKERIENYFNKVSGKIVMADNGSAVAIFYANSMVVPTGDPELKRIQINLHTNEWSVN
ncbi:MAG: hypothetical protein J6V25_07300 [Oscillospiraceae bacterium]|nr:hypothetical protein [Oscillospiraceae bacterium]